MSGKIPREFIDDLLVRVDIVDLIDSHVPLKKSGSNFSARCPFHTEKTPSFSVNRKKQFYHCFGCGVGGNAISFLMDYSHLDFVEAIEDLAGFVGVDVPREAVEYQQRKQDYSALYSMLERVAVFYVEQLRSHSKKSIVVEYLKKRGLSGAVAKDFSLGYAPDEWGLLSSKFDEQLLLDAGMLSRNEKGRVYDRFRGRLMFPIRDKRKRIIGFGGRVLDDSLPKYLNSPETAVFSKGKELYGLYELLEKQSKPKKILIVEGYMDVLALAQYGINYSVAALGTATSKTHLDLLFRFTSELVFCFDGDEAGRKAGWRAVQEAFPCLRDGRQVKIMILPQGEDPDTLVRKLGVEGFERSLFEAQALSDYFFEFIGSGLSLATMEGRAQLLVKAKPDLEKIPGGFFRDMMLERLKKLAGALSLNSLKSPVALRQGRDVVQANGKKDRGQLSPARLVIALLLQNPDLIEIINQCEFEWSELTFQGADVLKEVVYTIGLIKPGNAGVLVESFRGTPSEKIVNTLVKRDFFIPEEGVEAEFSGAFNRLLERADEVIYDRLVNKEQAKGLSSAEKEQIRKLLVKKCN